MATWPASGNTDWNTKMLAYLAIGHDTDGTHKKSQMLTDMGYSPTSYTGGESVTFPNNLIIKFGNDGKASGDTDYTETITFGTPFPDSCLAAVASPRARAGSSNGAFVHELTANSFKITNNDYGKCYWIAIGF